MTLIDSRLLGESCRYISGKNTQPAYFHVNSVCSCRDRVEKVSAAVRMVHNLNLSSMHINHLAPVCK